MDQTDTQNLVVYGIYRNREQLEKAIDEFKIQGFRNDDISVLFSSPATSKDFAQANSTKAPEGAVVGGTTGALVGGVLGWLAGIGTIIIPGVGPFIAAGPVMSALGGASAGGVVGGITGGLVGMGMPEYEAKRYDGLVRNGGILVSLHADDSDWRTHAQKVLEDTGAEDITASDESDIEHNEVDRARIFSL